MESEDSEDQQESSEESNSNSPARVAEKHRPRPQALN